MNNKKDFPFLSKQSGDTSFTYLDSASTAHKPQAVIDALNNFYAYDNANIHRVLYASGEKATQQYEQARKDIAQFINAQPHEIIFTKGATEGINAVAYMVGMHFVKKHHTILLTQLEHHANLLPWQAVADSTQAQLQFIPIDSKGGLDITDLDTLITGQTKVVAITHVSNALGTQVDIETIVHKAGAVGAYTLIDASQSIAHQPLDVKKIGCDFLVFSGHKIGGPTGVGVLYIKDTLHATLQPYQKGGSMVHSVTWHTATWAASPHKFEAGTPPIAQAIGLGAAINYCKTIDFSALQTYEASLCAYVIQRLSGIKEIILYGPLEQLSRKGHIVTFNVKGWHAHDVAAYLDSKGIAVRAGNHCAQPLMQLLGIQGSVRMSVYMYNDFKDVEMLCDAVELLCPQENNV